MVNRSDRHQSNLRGYGQRSRAFSAVRRCGFAAVCAVAALVGALPTAQPVSAAEVLPRAVGVIVGVRPGATIAAINSRHATTTVGTIPEFGAALVRWTDARTVDAVIAELLLDPDVTFADPNRTVRAPEVAFSGRIYKWTSTPPEAAGTQWATTTLRLAEAHQIARGAGVVVAIVDTGVAATHPALVGSVAPGIDLVDRDSNPADTRNGLDENRNGVIDEAAGHGTHVAGIVHMVAPAASLMPVRVLDSDGNADTFRVAAGIAWAASHGAQVINLSLGQTGSSTLLKNATDRLWTQGVMVVGAAGNEAKSSASYPAAARCALNVTATTATDRLASYASYGSKVDVAAPGDGIVSAFPYTASLTASWSGTSMAAPMVAGEVALIKSRRPTLRVGQIARLVVNNGVAVVQPPGGFGTARRIDVVAALTAAGGTVPTSNGCLG